MYTKELTALLKAKRLRTREHSDENLDDFASNDYLGLAHLKVLFERAISQLSLYPYHAPKASMMVNGYHPIHTEFETMMARQNGFEVGIVCGSGFLANFSLIEALPRSKDMLILDEEYHASGIVASKTLEAKVAFFRHNDAEHLEQLIASHTTGRVIVGVEGIYSMRGDLLNPAIFEVVDRHEALLIVDEAHSVGVVGERLRGVFEHFHIAPKPNHIKMGTLGKALGSYGAYILCSDAIAQFLLSRAKALIYTTAPSLFDIALGYQGVLYLLKHAPRLREAIVLRQKVAKRVLGYTMEGLILPYAVASNADALQWQARLKEKGFWVGAIRPPTVKSPMLRIIPRLHAPVERFEALCDAIKVLEA